MKIYCVYMKIVYSYSFLIYRNVIPNKKLVLKRKTSKHYKHLTPFKAHKLN